MISIRPVTTVGLNLNIYAGINSRATSLLPLFAHYTCDEAHTGHGTATSGVNSTPPLDSCWLLAWELVTPQVGIQQCALEKKLVFRSSEGNLE
jgi:hypothetical protein